ncbi:TIGR02147 family protein [Chitinivibrio alkaliphilus]|uniref:DUF4423 domain-containing protein n=1 Tax=Chitinivibrio alkaliphilus ACht1 TaxID=1313304 RepID=U7D7E3_9BACT|nr:TIGR02147 family protein [Chitinivibrio alkaliphilus]ERP31843.1 hypothetical protein CALK_1292 [Chitinivibrio alkaliphilus ACht1]
MKTIFEYLDYRVFLREYYEQKKEGSASFSLRLFGKKSGIDPSYLSKVIKEKRHIGERNVPDLAEALSLDNLEREYLETLLRFNKAPTEEQKQQFFEQLLSLRRPHTKCLTEEQFQFYSKWYYSALRNLLEFYPFYAGDDYGDLGKELSPPISAEEAQQGIALLEKLSLIKQDRSQRYRLTEHAISTGESWSSLAIRNFQKETILLSSEALRRHGKQERDISSITMNITEKEFPTIQNMLRRFRASLISYVNEIPRPNRVYQLNLQLIPLSQKHTDTSGDTNDTE